MLDMNIYIVGHNNNMFTSHSQQNVLTQTMAVNQVGKIECEDKDDHHPNPVAMTESRYVPPSRRLKRKPSPLSMHSLRAPCSRKQDPAHQQNTRQYLASEQAKVKQELLSKLTLYVDVLETITEENYKRPVAVKRVLEKVQCFLPVLAEYEITPAQSENVTSQDSTPVTTVSAATDEKSIVSTAEQMSDMTEETVTADHVQDSVQDNVASDPVIGTVQDNVTADSTIVTVHDTITAHQEIGAIQDTIPTNDAHPPIQDVQDMYPGDQENAAVQDTGTPSEEPATQDFQDIVTSEQNAETFPDSCQDTTTADVVQDTTTTDEVVQDTIYHC